METFSYGKGILATLWEERGMLWTEILIRGSHGLKFLSSENAVSHMLNFILVFLIEYLFFFVNLFVNNFNIL